MKHLTRVELKKAKSIFNEMVNLSKKCATYKDHMSTTSGVVKDTFNVSFRNSVKVLHSRAKTINEKYAMNVVVYENYIISFPSVLGSFHALPAIPENVVLKFEKILLKNANKVNNERKLNILREKMGITLNYIKAKSKVLLLTTDPRTCPCCKQPVKFGELLTGDHIWAKSKHGDLTSVYANIQGLCQPCNSEKGNKQAVDYRDVNTKRNIIAVTMKAYKTDIDLNVGVLTEKQVDVIINRLLIKTVDEISSLCDVSPSTVSRILSKLVPHTHSLIKEYIHIRRLVERR